MSKRSHKTGSIVQRPVEHKESESPSNDIPELELGISEGGIEPERMGDSQFRFALFLPSDIPVGRDESIVKDYETKVWIRVPKGYVGILTNNVEYGVRCTVFEDDAKLVHTKTDVTINRNFLDEDRDPVDEETYGKEGSAFAVLKIEKKALHVKRVAISGVDIKVVS